MICQGILNKHNPRELGKTSFCQISEFYELILPLIPSINLVVTFPRICAEGHNHIAADNITIVNL